MNYIDVMKQALEASESFADGIYYENEEDDIGRRFCCGVLAYKPHKENCVAAASATALRQAITEAEKQQALDAMADNAKELGIGLQPAPPECKTEAEKKAYAYGWYKALESVREQPAQQQEPVAWRNAALRVGEDLCSVGPFGYYDMTAEQWLDWALSVVTVHAPPTPPRQPDHIRDATEMVDPDELTIAYLDGLHEGKKRKPWVGLTDEDFVELCDTDLGTAALIRKVEAKLKEKNQ